MTGAERIAAERRRQIEAEGWTPEHDDEHVHGEIAWAAVCYAAPALVKAFVPVPCGCREACCEHVGGTVSRWTDPWPWERNADKRRSATRIRDLEKAGALIAAEIDRLQRLA